MKLAAAALLLLFTPAAFAQAPGGCQSACGDFGDEHSCRQCLSLKKMDQNSPAGNTLPSRRPSRGVGQEQWQEERAQEDLMRSERTYRQFCVDTASC